MNLFELSAKISVDDTNFKKSMENAQKVSKNVATAMQQLQSPLDKAKSGFNAIAHPIETAKANFEKLKNATEAMRHPIETFKNKVADASTALETKRNKLSTLAAGYDSAKKKVDDLTKEFNKSAKESGTSSQKTQELAKKLNEAEKEAEEAKRELDDYSKSVSKAGKNSDSASKGVGNFASKLGKGLATAGKVAGAALGVAAAGITALTTAAVNNYAEYEQLVGGVETLFKDSATKIQDFADRAYQTAGLSANEYMSTVTSFSASLLQSLGGDTEKAADYADMAITDMADNANKMGTSMELIQNAYQGFAKQNYTMLDNLKLGYGGTKEEMARLIEDAAKLDKSIDANDMSFGNIVKSINAVQKEMGIYGTTAKEASATISGSLAAVKAQWNNLLTAISQGDDWDIGVYISNLVKTVSTAFNNLMPVIQKSLVGIAELISQLAPIIVEKLPEVVNDVVPALISGATSMVNAVIAVLPDLLNTVVDALIQNAPALITAAIGLVQSLIQGIQDNYQILVDGAIQIVTQLATGILNMLPQIVQLGLDLIVSLANGIAESLPELIPTIIDVVLQIVETLTNPETLTNILDAAMVLIENLAYGLMDAIPQLVQAALLIIENLVAFLLDPANLAKLLKMAFDLIVGIGTGLINAIPELLKSVTRIITGIIAMFKDADWGKIGKDLVDGFKNGISKAWTNLKKWFKDLFGDLIGIAKKILGIASPSKVFKKLGSFTADGFGIGFEDEFAHVKDDMEDALNFDDASVGINASIRKVGAGAAGGAFGGTSIGKITINIDGAKYDDEQSLAIAVAEEIQRMTDRRSAVYA